MLMAAAARTLREKNTIKCSFIPEKLTIILNQLKIEKDNNYLHCRNQIHSEHVKPSLDIRSLQVCMSSAASIFIVPPLLLTCMLYYVMTAQCQFHVVAKSTGRPLSTKFLTDQMFVMHHVNTYEDDGHLVVDVCAFEDASFIKSLKIEDLYFSGDRLPSIDGEYQRFVIPLRKPEVMTVSLQPPASIDAGNLCIFEAS